MRSSKFAIFTVGKNSFKHHPLFIIALLIVLSHFIMTSIVEHYIAAQIGSRIGQVVAEGFEDATESHQPSEKEAEVIYQSMKNKSNEVISRWKIPMLLLALPIKPVIQPLLNKIRKAWLYEPVFSKKISKDQFRTRGIIIETSANALNSLIVGFLTYFLCKLISRKNRRR